MSLGRFRFGAQRVIDHMRKPPSSVLGTSEIRARLARGEIFRRDTWLDENIRAEAYDLRIARDLMVVPELGHPEGRRYGREEGPTRPGCP